MISPIEWILAGRYLRARREEGFISVIAVFSLVGIALGVATLIIVMAVMNGFRAELLGRIMGINGHVVVHGISGLDADARDNLIGRLSEVQGVRRVTPFVEGQVLASGPQGRAQGALVRGIRPADLSLLELVANGMIAASPEEFSPGNGVVMGQRLANRLNLLPGDMVRLLSPRGTPTAFGTIPRARAFKILGFFEIGMFEYDSTFIFMPLSDAQNYFCLDKSVNGLELIVENPEQVKLYREPLIEALGRAGRLIDWQDANANFFNALQVERNVMFLILSLIILIAAFNIISSMIMLVNDKARGIAILRTMGATRGMVMRVFLIAGSSIGVVGTFSGLILGTAFCSNIENIRRFLESFVGADLFSAEIYFLSQIPADMNTDEVTYTVLLALGLSLLATLYPAWRAARLDPVEVLRYE
jgi:lipoprotein-releasing system permease protein